MIIHSILFKKPYYSLKNYREILHFLEYNKIYSIIDVIETQFYYRYDITKYNYDKYKYEYKYINDNITYIVAINK